MHLHAADPQNTLKVTTQVFSVLVFLCFFKYQRPLWPAFFDVPRTTFGMYLSHVLILAAFTYPLRTLLDGPHPHPFARSFVMRVAMWLATTAFVSGLSFAISRTLSASPALSWTVGSNWVAGRARGRDRSSDEGACSAKAAIETAS